MKFQSGSKSESAPIAKALSFVAAALALYAIYTTFSIVVAAYSPVLFGDQWNLIGWLQPDNHITLPKLWQQHNEHRHLIGRLLSTADLFFFGARNISLIVEILCIQILHGILIVWMVCRFSQLPRPLLITVIAVIAYCVISPLQMENFVWGFQGPFVLVGLAASVCFAAAVYRASLPPEATLQRAATLSICILAAFVSEASQSNGVIAWPLLLMLALALRFSTRDRWLIGLSGIAAIAAYMIGYHTPSYHSNPIDSIRHPLSVLKYTVTYFGSSWDYNLPNNSNWPVFSEAVTTIVIVWFVVEVFRIVALKKECSRLKLFCLTTMLFGLLTGIVTALGRLKFGYDQAASSRYQSIALIFYACLGVIIAEYLAARVNSWRAIIAAQAVLIFLLAGAGSQYVETRDWAVKRRVSLEQGYFVLEHDPANAAAVEAVYPNDTNDVLKWNAYLHKNGWAPRVDYPWLIVPTDTGGSIAGYELVSRLRCGGAIERATVIAPGTFNVAGWAVDVGTASPPDRIALASSAGGLVGMLVPSAPRPDIVDNLSGGLSDDRIGWSGHIKLSPNGIFRAYAILDGGKSACALGNELLTGSEGPAVK